MSTVKRLKNIVKSIGGIKLIRRASNRLNYYWYRIIASNKYLSVLHHTLLSQSFVREMFAQTSGVASYYAEQGLATKGNPVLRRNIHRLEKGMLMNDQRAIFALDYIEETVETYTNIIAAKNDEKLDPDELQWAYDVLNKYFEVADDTHPKIRGLKTQFERLKRNIVKRSKYVPYPQERLTKKSPVTYEKLLELAKKRRSIRWFLKKKVPRKLIDKALVVAGLSPTACNRQPYYYRIYDQPKLVQMIANIPFGTAGYADNIPVIAVLLGKQNNFFSARDRHLIYIDTSLSAMSFMLALETLGISSCAINWPDFGYLENIMMRALRLKPYERPIVLLAIGYADKTGMVASSPKKELNQIRSYNEVG